MSPSWEQRVLSQKLAEQSKDSEESQPPQDTTSAPEPQSSILPAGESFIARLAKRLRKNNHPKDLTGVPQVKARWPFNWISRKSTLPLYTSSLGKSALIATADVASATIETIRGGRDRLLGTLFHTDFDPEITVVDTDCLTVTLALPALQLASTGTSKQRIRQAEKDLLENGHFSVKPKLPPGKSRRNGGTIIPTPSPDNGLIDPIKRANAQTNRLLKWNNNWPIAWLHFEAGSLDQAWLMLKQKNLLSETESAQASLLHDLTINAQVQGLDRHGNQIVAKQEFPLGQTSLQFGEDGRLQTSAYEINGVYFHPALLSLTDFARLMSARLAELSGRTVTIAPETAVKALIIASSADEDTREIIGQYINRMQAIGNVSTLLNRAPSELAQGLWQVINIVDRGGNPHDQADDLHAAVIGTLLGFEDVHSGLNFGRPTTYVGFVNWLYRLFKETDAYVEFSGNPKVISVAVENAYDWPDLMELVKKMGVDNPEALRGNPNPKVMNIAEFLSFYLTPEVITTSTLALMDLHSTNARAILAQAKMMLHRTTTIDGVITETLELDRQYWKATLDHFLEEAKKIDPTAKGRATAQAVITALREKYEVAGQKIIDATVSPVEEKKSLPDHGIAFKGKAAAGKSGKAGHFVGSSNDDDEE